MGRISAISTSKIRKMMAIRKNWMENGMRDLDLGEKPHSNGEFFSLSENVLIEIKFSTITRISMIMMMISKE